MGAISESASRWWKAPRTIVDKGVEDGHSLVRDTGVRMHLLEHLVDVRRVGYTRRAMVRIGLICSGIKDHSLSLRDFLRFFFSPSAAGAAVFLPAEVFLAFDSVDLTGA